MAYWDAESDSSEFEGNTDSYDDSDSEYEPALRDSLCHSLLTYDDDEPAFKDSLLIKLLPGAVSDNEDDDMADMVGADDVSTPPGTSGMAAGAAPAPTAAGPTASAAPTRDQSFSGEPEKDARLRKGSWQWTVVVEDVPFINEDITFNSPRERLSATAAGATTELDHLSLFLETPIIDDIVKCTNIAARRSDGPGHRSVTTNSIMAYIGLNIAMGMTIQDSVNDYWSEEPIMDMPFFRRVMTHADFLYHQYNLRLADDEGCPAAPDGKQSDEAYMIRTLLDSFSKSFQEHYRPSRELRVDNFSTNTESPLFCLFGSRSPQSSVTLWTLSDSEVRYCLSFDVWKGRTDKTFSVDLLDRLMAQYQGRGHVLYLGNFCTSLLPFRHLHQHKTLAVGTILRSCEHFPARLRSRAVNLKDGQSLVAQSGPLTVCKWAIDGKVIFLASTLHGKSVTVTQVTKGRGRRAREVTVREPTVVHDYNANMGVFNFWEKCLSFHPVVLRSGEWWRGAFWRLLDVAIVNAFALWKFKGLAQGRKSEQQHHNFRNALAMQLTEPYMGERCLTAGVQGPTYESAGSAADAD